MQKILLVDDNFPFCKSFCETFDSRYEITVADSIAVLHDRLYCDPGVDKYDNIILDLEIGFGEYTEAEWAEICEEFNGIELFLLNRNRALYGWDYYFRVICTRDKTKNYNERFVLFSAHVDALRRQAPQEQIAHLGNRLVKKGTLASEAELMKIIG